MVADGQDVDTPVVRAIPALEAVGFGAFAHDSTTGEVYVTHRDRRPRQPASTTKLVTTALALDRLGPDHRFATHAICRHPAVPPGDDRADHSDTRLRDRVDRLILRGDWMSDLSVEELQALAGTIRGTGVDDVGDIVLDVSNHDPSQYAPGWTWEDECHAYGAKSTPLALGGNTVDVTVWVENDVRVSVEPSSAVIECTVTADIEEEEPPSDSGDETPSISVSREHGSSTIRVDGKLAPADEHTGTAPVADPFAHLGDVLRREFEAAGITVDGSLRLWNVPPGKDGGRGWMDRQTDRTVIPTGTGDVAAGGNGEGTTWVAAGTNGWIRRSAPIRELIRTTNVTSDNFVAEQMARAVAQAEREFGSWSEWESVVAEVFDDLEAGPVTLRDGSGLSQYNRITPRGLVCVLDWALTRPWCSDFLRSLPVAGEDGTLTDRLGDVEPTIRAKTGTLTGTRALAGVIKRDEGPITFAALLGGLTGDHEARGHDYLDEFVRELVDTCN